MKWYNCKPITDCASTALCLCRKDGEYVIVYDEEYCWVRISTEKARQHFQITGEVEDSDQIEEAYQWSLKRDRSATSSGGSEKDTQSTPSEPEENLGPGQTTE